MANNSKTDKQERIWNDPPMVGERQQPVLFPEQVTLGAGASPEIRQAFAALNITYRRIRLITTVVLSLSFTIAYAILSSLPEVTPLDILTFFILATIMSSLAEIARYYKVI